ncbi:MAG: hypothetical protein ACRDKH_04470 [Solirubrobacterales bacterium]
MTEPRRNPFRSEADAFRLLMLAAASAALVVAVAVITRPLFGALVGLLLVALGLWRAWGWVREWFAARPGSSEEGDAGRERQR